MSRFDDDYEWDFEEDFPPVTATGIIFIAVIAAIVAGAAGWFVPQTPQLPPGQ